MTVSKVPAYSALGQVEEAMRAKRADDRLLTLPIVDDIGIEACDYVCETIKKILENSSLGEIS